MSDYYILPNNFTITAHTGCEDTIDNSIESIIKACSSGADIFEVDVQFDKNGIPVLSHDDIIGGEVTLESAFRILKDNMSMQCNIDIKKITNLKIIPEIAKKYNVLNRIFFTGISVDFVDAAKETPEIPYYLNIDIAPIKNHTDEYYFSLVNTVKNYGAIGINCHHKNITKKLVDIFHKSGLLVSIWTCNDVEDILRILKFAPDNITSRNPSLVKKIISSNIFNN